LLLTTTGRKTGARRRTALIYGRDGADFLIVASKGGAPDHPVWYLNLMADPRAEIQVGADVMAVEATTLDGEDRDRAWSIMTKIWPAYDTYQTKTDRQIPIIRLRRVG
jgi:deazaflavin-dependent oxidoreductase (nitroreductase family)